MKKRTIMILLGIMVVFVSGIFVIRQITGVETVANPSAQVKELSADYFYGNSARLMTCNDIYYRESVKLEWKSIRNATRYSVAIATRDDFSDKVVYETEECFLELENLLAGTDYYWAVTANGKTLTTRHFYTADTVRTITIEGVSNTRDCGGWKTEDGEIVKQGMIYRGAKLENITEEGKKTMLEELGIRTDLDLRTNEETNGRSSVLGDSVIYLNYSGPYYWGGNGIATQDYREALLGEIRAFADEHNYPIYVHCSLGRDRTGTICFLINALLGVSEKDLFLDYELSFLSSAGTLDAPVVSKMISEYQNMYNQVKKYAPDGTMAEATEEFMLWIGVTQDEIDTIRQLLLD